MKNSRISLKKPGEAAHTYQMKHKNRIIWEGADLKKQLNIVKREIPLKEITISWKADEETTIG